MQHMSVPTVVLREFGHLGMSQSRSRKADGRE